MKTTRLLLLLITILFGGTFSTATAKPKNKSLEYALIHAVTNGETKRVKLLLKQGAPVNIADRDGNWLIIKAAYVNETPYQYSAPHSLKLFKLILSHGAHVNVKNHEGVTPLMAAAFEGCLEAVQLLVEKGVQLNSRDTDGTTALMYACFAQDEGSPFAWPDVVEYLLAHGANLNARNKEGSTALIRVMQLEKEQQDIVLEIAKMLIAKGADVNIRTNNSNTALKWAKAKGHTSVIQLLQQAGARE